MILRNVTMIAERNLGIDKEEKKDKQEFMIKIHHILIGAGVV